MGDDFPVDELTDEVEIIFEDEDDEPTVGPVAVDDADDADVDAETTADDDDEKGLKPALSELDQARVDVADLRESYLRKLAEFDNFRKRTEREKVELRRTAGEDVIRELVPVLDNFERALIHSGEADDGAFRTGVEMISRQLNETLERLGLHVINPVGEAFQPEMHEALQRVEDADHPPGTVVSVLAKGYRFGGKLIRPAMVSVSVHDEPEPAPVSEAEGEPSQ